VAFAPLDLAVLGVYLISVLGLGIWVARRAGESEAGFFLAGRRLPWWLAGTSLIATSLSVDTPLGIAGLVEEHGIPGVWFAWCFALGGAGMLGYALFSELWRRSGVMTDAAFVELRYGGRGGAALRLVKALYLGIFLNAFTLAWVLKAVTTLGAELMGGSPHLVLGVVLALTLAYSAASGLWGVAVSDLPQYVVILGTFSWLAVRSMARAGGPGGLAAALGERFGAAEAAQKLAFVPAPGEPFFGTFLAYVFLLWWVHRNASAAGPVVQRLAACRDERDARRSTLLFTVGTFAVNYWPMVVMALAALALYPSLPAEVAVGRLFRDGLPPGLLGLAAAALLAAFMSTVDSHLNLGASYLVHDVIHRFVRPAAGERELVAWARLSTAILLALAVGIAARMDSVAGAWQLLSALTAGYGPVTIVRWFWWRITAWSELAALLASGVVSFLVGRWAPDLSFGAQLALIAGATAPVWAGVALWGPEPHRAAVERFARTVRPWGVWPGPAPASSLGGRLLLWMVGSGALLTTCFALGAAIFARWPLAGGLAACSAGGWALFLRLDRRRPATAQPTP
jgi:Na+/proline symporter